MQRQKNEPRHLLDTEAEQNIGNSFLLQPQAGSGGTIVPQSSATQSYERILQLSGPSKSAQTTSVVFTACRVAPGPSNPNPGYAGPVTGILEFGNGGRFTRVEFDVPVGPYLGNFDGSLTSTEPQDGGTVITVPSGVLRADARYDNLLVQALLGPPRSTAQALGVAFVGPGGPVSPPGAAAPAEPVLVKAMAAFFTRHWAKLYKTQYCYVGAPGVPAQALLTQSTPLGLNVATYCVPPFAKSVKVLRNPVSAAMVVELYDGVFTTLNPPTNNNGVDEVAVPAGASPTIDIVGNETVVRVSSATANDKVKFLALVYEIGL